MKQWRPLDWFRSIRTKLSVLVGGSVIIAVALGGVDPAGGWPIWLRMGASVAIGLGVMRLVAGGITSPLRDMADAARAMADGDYSRRVRATSRDEVGQLADAFNEMSTKLAEVDRQRRDLVANASHELRTPIAALQAMIENLADGVSEADPAFVSTMHDQVKRLATLVDQLMSLSRLDSGETPLHLEQVSLAAVVSHAVEEFQWHHPELGVDVAITPQTLMADLDEILMHRVLMNLLENASRYGAPPISITAELRGTPGTRPVVVLTVADHGPGIAPDDANRVFERFQRLDQARRSGGSGLGLAIVAGIIERHHGRIEVAPNEPSGCRMVITLPQETHHQ